MGRSFMYIVDYAPTIEDIHCEAQGAMVKGRIIREVIVRAIMTHC